MSAFTRRQFLTSAAAGAIGACAAQPARAVRRRASGDVPWLADVVTPPPAAPGSTLSSLLVDARGERITSLDAWRRRRAGMEETWRGILGRLGATRETLPDVELVEREQAGDVVRELVRYAAEPGLPTEAYILRPRRSGGPRPGVLVFHTTTPESIRQPAGLSDVPEKHFGLALARRGFVAFCPRNFLWPQTTTMAAQEETRRFRRRHPRALGMAKMLFDGQVALDLLAARPDVDPGRLGCIGHSLGAKEALYLAAFDRRIAAAVSSEGGVGTAMSNWDAEWYLGGIVRQPGFAHDHHELLALAAPRPFLLVGGGSADGAASWPFVAAAQPVYRLYGEPARLGLLVHDGGHAVPPAVLPRMLEWLETYV